ncbi:hypothetical protein IQ219_10905 [Synechocystis sp. LEGE 06083]|uniref:DUF6884 domain-containing protein n=1 Tax=Synechocystis sp. LEGE 06083 TaxID=915336 RepID=UPI0018823178|nr:DUF6884 domain-containing protein [Synechocystis sp. LEGE 06083]MBE9195800.1 hypothetical protein [Synechocystis sp. LEGE 06083]
MVIKKEEKSLLLISCSRKKIVSGNNMPAIERYDGPAFRLLRRFLAQKEASYLDIYILSAKFGIIPYDTPIPNYDEKLTKNKIKEISGQSRSIFREILNSQQYTKLHISAGKQYLHLIDGYQKYARDNLQVEVATGSIGRKLSHLRYWLYGDLPQKENYKVQTQETSVRIATFKGVSYSLTYEEIYLKAKNSIDAGIGRPFSYESWYILIGEEKISTKWLVSQLTGLPVGQFHSIAARKFLGQLGVVVYSDFFD